MVELRSLVRCSFVPLVLTSSVPVVAQEVGGGSSPPTDAQIAAIVVTANAIDIAYGRLARERSRNAAVQSFASTMIADHTAVNEQAAALVARLGVEPEENEMSRALAAAAEAKRAELSGKSGAEFDRAYIENEVAFHQLVLDALDGTLLPNAKNAELRALLQAVRPAIVAHLEHAKQLRTAVSAGGAAPPDRTHGVEIRDFVLRLEGLRAAVEDPVVFPEPLLIS